MRQLQLFTPAEIAVMRDRTKSRNYSPAGEEFRREHERHRAWGLTQRHTLKLRRLHGGTLGSFAPDCAEEDRTDETPDPPSSRKAIPDPPSSREAIPDPPSSREAIPDPRSSRQAIPDPRS